MDHLFAAFRDELEKISGVKDTLRGAYSSVDDFARGILGMTTQGDLAGKASVAKYEAMRSALPTAFADTQFAKDRRIAEQFLSKDEFKKIITDRPQFLASNQRVSGIRPAGFSNRPIPENIRDNIGRRVASVSRGKEYEEALPGVLKAIQRASVEPGVSLTPASKRRRVRVFMDEVRGGAKSRQRLSRATKGRNK